MASVSVNDDYASLRSKNADFYYGYEVTAQDGEEWCFQATINGVKTVMPHSKFAAQTDMFNCHMCLLAGIARILDSHRLESV